MPSKVRLSQPPTHLNSGLPYQWNLWIKEFRDRVGEGPLAIQGYEISSLPDPGVWGSSSDNPFSSLIFVSDETGGPTLAFSDGTNWLRVQDRAVVS